MRDHATKQATTCSRDTEKRTAEKFSLLENQFSQHQAKCASANGPTHEQERTKQSVPNGEQQSTKHRNSNLGC
jgi:hypothetical protein